MIQLKFCKEAFDHLVSFRPLNISYGEELKAFTIKNVIFKQNFEITDGIHWSSPNTQIWIVRSLELWNKNLIEIINFKETLSLNLLTEENLKFGIWFSLS